MPISLPSQSKMLAPNFIFGVATASFQIEGATDADHRLTSIWDTFCATPGKVKGGDNGEQACDHYHRWEEDIALIKDLGVDAYRLSIAWPRVMNEQGEANQAGLDFYQRLLTRLKAEGLTVFVTLYHWDLPQYLEDKGGWLNRETAYQFKHYADIVSNALGEWVDSWATFNEPFCAAILGYELGIHAPGLSKPEYGRQAAHHILLAHGLALPVIRHNAPNAQVGIVLNMNRSYAASEKAEDQFACLMRDILDNQFFIEPLMKGQYPQLLNKVAPQYLPNILPGDMAIISQPIDFLGMNYYTCNHNAYDANHLFKDVKNAQPVEYTDIGWEIAPHAFTELLVNLNKQYRLPPLYITENGMACADHNIDGDINDEQRVRYLHSHLNAVHHAIEAGVDIRGYFAWSLMDNFEWAEGYSKRFGLIYVDYQTQQRTMKRSGHAYRALMDSRAG
ncbi:GH1 family beta-glucosidase [Marinomonas sp. IMCC 4694]|uniref:GH1 family beta-glucosidase n=1 Tax=Marinomonas sp. IMCC 4694 TaxID=2605432 RepID=UPI0011E6920F|nr:GH1 family beta-glucosidase [Marinomonas sp. IMCC 4694]TYL49144.1 beta-glucosidase [Marinomonas sp. IMCC 4694]